MSRLIWGVTVSLSVTSTLVSQARPTSAIKGKGLVNCVHKLCPATLHNAAQSCYSILSHDTLHHHLSSNNGLENGNRELGQLFCFYWGCKNTSTTSQRYFKSVLFEIWLHHLANCIPVGQDLNMQFTRPFSSFAEVVLACKTTSTPPPRSNTTKTHCIVKPSRTINKMVSELRIRPFGQHRRIKHNQILYNNQQRCALNRIITLPQNLRLCSFFPITCLPRRRMLSQRIQRPLRWSLQTSRFF